MQYYAEADKRIAGIHKKFLASEGLVTDDQVLQAVRKITGMYRIEQDWKKANEGKKCPKGADPAFFALENFEAWVAKKPKAYRRIYGSAQVISGFILNEGEE